MRRTRKLIVTVIYLDLLLLISAETTGQNTPTPELVILLNNSMKWLTWQESVSMQLQIDVLGSDNGVQNFHVLREYTFRRDRERIEWIGKIIHLVENINNSHNRMDIMTGEYYLKASYLFDRKPEFATIQLDYKELQQDMLEDNDTGGPLFGRLYMTDRKNIIEIIKEAQDITLSNERENINGISCYEIKGKSKYGEITAYIAPDNGFSVMKWMINKGPEHYKGPLEIKNWIVTYEVKELIKINDTFVPGAANHVNVIEEVNGIKHVGTCNYKTNNVVLKPDFDALGAFKINLPDDTPIRIMEHPELEYTWHGGKIVDSYGHEVDLETMEPPSMIGKTLPDLAQFNLNPNHAQAKNKMILICFWDMNQRPSRNAIQTMNKKASSLMDNGLYMVFIHTGPVAKQTLVPWLNQNEIQSLVGVSNESLPELGNTWGVQSLPWLILTDKNHVVVAEGFALNELNEKIRNAENKVN